MTKKDMIKPIIVLCSICLVIAALLGVVHIIAQPIIDEANRKAVEESLTVVMKDGSFNAEPDNLPADAPETVHAIYTEKNGKGHVVLLVIPKGYEGEINLTLGVDTEGKITGMVITKNEDSITSHGMEAGGTYGNAYIGADASTVPDLVTGATAQYSEAAIKKAINDAFKALGFADGESAEKLPKTDEELLTLANSLAGEEVTNITPEDRPSTLKRLYSFSGGFIAYTITSTEYVAVETEAMLRIDKNGNVTAVEQLFWVAGHKDDSDAEYVESVKNFFASFVGKNNNTIGSVELISGVTGTSEHLRDAINDAVNTAVPPLVRPESEILSEAEKLIADAGGFEDVTPGGTVYVKKLYKSKDGKGYAAYLNTIASHGGTLETETLIAIDGEGKITGIKKLFWTVGHNPAYGGPAAPSEETVDAFYQSFVGKKLSDITSVELITDCTGTSENVYKSVNEALSEIDEIIAANSAENGKNKFEALPRVIGIVLAVLLVGGTAAVIVFEKKRGKAK